MYWSGSGYPLLLLLDGISFAINSTSMPANSASSSDTSCSSSSLSALAARVSVLESGPSSDLHYIGTAGEVSFVHGWHIYSSESPTLFPPYYSKSGNVVRLGGLVAGPVGFVLFTLPASYAPSSYRFFLCDSANTSNGLVSEFAIAPNGDVALRTGPAALVWAVSHGRAAGVRGVRERRQEWIAS
jgi:hypothetical protein